MIHQNNLFRFFLGKQTIISKPGAPQRSSSSPGAAACMVWQRLSRLPKTLHQMPSDTQTIGSGPFDEVFVMKTQLLPKSQDSRLWFCHFLTQKEPSSCGLPGALPRDPLMIMRIINSTESTGSGVWWDLGRVRYKPYSEGLKSEWTRERR